ncbi:uncharacterized protein IP91_02110 [Pseudoduganella lurida]|uniref:Preprotein translocase subunit YajC n=1 Tax=Pseudoduganella lurida TaxID=1036180 RepID=A0A562RB84_9BURK|nr:PP0621 family protein [Pseudoduganella lurida]TWI66298.1 uncharacterized protein IP91_02110 [Pseudoduganella lurida]
MSRFLFWVALALLIYFAVRAKIRQSARKQQEEYRRQYQQQQEAQQPARQVAPPETMLLCAHCGVHFPASENVPAGGRDYCSPAHVPH